MPLERPMTDGRSPWSAKSVWPEAKASFTAGPAPLKNDHSILTPGSFANSSSR